MTNLADKQCVPCEGGVPALSSERAAELLEQIPGWTIDQNHHLDREYALPDFVTALAFVNQVGELAEQQGHHPDIYLTWGKVRIQIWTHKIDGLSESDFVLAAKIDALPGHPG